MQTQKTASSFVYLERVEFHSESTNLRKTKIFSYFLQQLNPYYHTPVVKKQKHITNLWDPVKTAHIFDDESL